VDPFDDLIEVLEDLFEMAISATTESVAGLASLLN